MTGLSKRSLEILALMAAAQDREDWEGAEIVCDGIVCWLGEERVSRSTVNALLRVVAVSQANEPGSLERYVISGTGREILKDPATADRITMALLSETNVDNTGRPV